MNEDDPNNQLVRVEHGLALTSLADNRILSEMVGASLVLARESAIVQIDFAVLASICFVAAQMTEELGREPSDQELAEEVGRSAAEVSKLKSAAIRLVSLESFIIPLIYSDSPEYQCKLATVDWYWRAAQLGHARAQYDLGCRYRNGDMVLQDYAEASKWFQKAAEQGNAEAQFALAVCYQDGRGVPRDDAEAVKWYLKAAELGYAEAQTSLGSHYNYEGMPEEAFKWYRKAAEQGDAEGQINVGAAYSLGEGVPKDISQAYKWFRLGADQGVEQAKKDAAALAALMSPSELEAAQRLYDEFKAESKAVESNPYLRAHLEERRRHAPLTKAHSNLLHQLRQADRQPKPRPQQ